MFSGPTVAGPVYGGGSTGAVATGGEIGAHPIAAATSAIETTVMPQALAFIDRSSASLLLMSASSPPNVSTTRGLKLGF